MRPFLHGLAVTWLTRAMTALDIVSESSKRLSLPSWATALFDYYRAEFNDPLYVRDPPFLQLYILSEALYTIPMSVYAIRGLIRGNEIAHHCRCAPLRS